MPFLMLFVGIRNALSRDGLGLEIMHISLPTTLALAADPIASLIDTAFIGHIGPVELAAVGVSIAIFNQVSKIAIIPLVSVTTSLVAEEESSEKTENHDEEKELLTRELSVDEEMRLNVELQAESTSSSSSANIGKAAKYKHRGIYIPSASSAIVVGAILGVLQAVFLIFTAKPLLNYMGVDSDSPILKPAIQYLTLRSFGAPAVILSMAMQGIFRGTKDAKTPLYATIMGDVANIILDPIFIFLLKLGIRGAAIAHITSQYMISLILLWSLMKQVDLLPPSINDFQFEKILKNGFLILLRVSAATFCVTLAASLAARLGSTTMAAFQFCLQVWMASSLIADGLAVAGQAIIARAFSSRDYEKVMTTTSRVLQLVRLGIPYVAVTLPINTLAFVFDGINYGASDFTYSACSMVLVAIVSILCLFTLSSSHGFVGIWIALSIYMSLRAFAGFWRLASETGPWRFLKENSAILT